MPVFRSAVLNSRSTATYVDQAEATECVYKIPHHSFRPIYGYLDNSRAELKHKVPVPKRAELAVSQTSHSFERDAAFYASDYKSFIRRSRNVGRVNILDVFQTPGDFSFRAKDDIVIFRMRGRANCHVNLGSGSFSRWSLPGEFAVSPTGFYNDIVVDHHHCACLAAIPWFALLEHNIEDALPIDSDLGRVHSTMTQDGIMSKIFDNLWGAAPDDTLTEGAALLAIAERLIAWTKGSERLRAKHDEKLTVRKLTRCQERLSQLDLQQPTLTELATLCNLSPFHFCRAFKAATGLPPHRYYIVTRIERARTLLLNNQASVAEIGAAVGYEDPAYFSRLFARETGVSPSAWRRGASIWK